ncbi:hypothetical protein BCR34DRAFT_593462 [Clohesyomyces aquaticus]|uniref:Uncharacterized protein n=1 Tax=Clohesyomyces aquaticus TaxID=1231657 RepID=A0A1Y1YHJ3_9PLEO|nr:hypothetical protein BCR34DRAFT_593462 [Clohesyomyces aquaticus]
MTKFQVLFLLTLLIHVVFAIDRDACAAGIRHDIETQGLNPNNSTFFYHVPAPTDLNGTFSLWLGICLSKCGHGFSWYVGYEISNRIVGWLIPVLVLIGNMHMPPLGGKYKAFSILHFIGDPIDSMLSLQHTLAVRRAAKVWAEKTVTEHGLDKLGERVTPQGLATVFWAFDTLNADSKTTPISILGPLLRLKKFPFAIAEAAADIRNTTVKESMRTYLAIITYLATVTTAFVKASSSKQQCDSRPGNRVALAMLYCWLLPAILLSTFSARFTTSDACIRAIRRFVRHLEDETVTEASIFPAQYHSRFIEKGRTADGVQEVAPWSGGIYVYRPRKPLLSSSLPGYPSPVYMLVLSVLPIIIAMCIAIGISYSTPTIGFGCRSIAEISIGCMWLFSFLVGLLLQALPQVTGEVQLVIIGIKDFVMGFGALLVVTFIYSGAFNSCWCWSNGLDGILNHSLHVLLGVDANLQVNAEKIYPGLVGGGLGAQVAVFGAMWGVGGWGNMSWWELVGVRREGNRRATVEESAGDDSAVPLVERGPRRNDE